MWRRRQVLGYVAKLDLGFVHHDVSRVRLHQLPVGTGPFKFVEFKPNEWIALVRNPDYWKPGRPYLDGCPSSEFLRQQAS